MAIVPEIELATVLPGALAFNEGNVSETYRGQVLRSDLSTANAIIKDVEAKEMANEMISFVLARYLALPIPDLVLASANPADLPAVHGPLTASGSRLVLASVDVSVPSVVFRYTRDIPGRARLLAALTAWPPLGRLYGFDAWIANVDRHAGNLLFGSGAEAWLIDHGYAFTGPNWTQSGLNPKASYPHRLGDWLTGYLTVDNREMRARQAAALEADLKLIDVNAAIAASRAALLLSADDIRAARQFLSGRIGEVVT
ncbi:hypothetical protein [Sphingomonas turrisvirgatae]|uniref:hypothetical protein n=1 Tax=Sphingomonas turrisvirgatae TaxID=1888892 RepID=UPI0010427256|nr:hypothetical protein [Sphingomonas turrisvirgatae]